MSTIENHDVWNSGRIEKISTIMNRYAEHVRVGHRLRLGIEGDPCNTYRSADDAPKGEVVRVDRGDDGYVGIDMRLDNGEHIHVDNRSVDPSRIWEVDPSNLAQFTNDAVGHASHERVNEEDRRFRGEIYSMITDTSKQLKELEDTESTFRKATTATIRHIVADLLNLASGNPLAFAREYADKYDIAMEKDSSSSRIRSDHNPDSVTNEERTYSGNDAKKYKYRHTANQHEKYDFELTPLQYNSPDLCEASIVTP